MPIRACRSTDRRVHSEREGSAGGCRCGCGCGCEGRGTYGDEWTDPRWLAGDGLISTDEMLVVGRRSLCGGRDGRAGGMRRGRYMDIMCGEKKKKGF